VKASLRTLAPSQFIFIFENFHFEGSHPRPGNADKQR